MLMISDLLLPARLGRMLREAAPADRWAAKILAYPCFDDGFRQAILATRLVELPFVLAIEADTPGQFVRGYCSRLDSSFDKEGT